ncbi:MAG: B12-binding domain-containing protein [Dethiosulfatibacter sp.]|nr:B12-binding domain-containing protein [Dethiosulfatibacter sp.]
MSDFGTRLKIIRKTRNITQSDLSKALGIAQSTVANYENNTRFPGESSLKDLSEYLEVSLDYLMGLTDLRSVAPQNINNEESIDEAVETFNSQELRNQILHYLINGKESEATKILKNAFDKGFELTSMIEQVIIPLMERVGSLWEDGEISVAQEHYISNVIESFIGYLSKSINTHQDKSYSALLITPLSEDHVLPLKLSSEYFRQKGWRVFYLGKSVPLKSLKSIMLRESIDVVVVSVTMDYNLKSAEHLITTLKEWELAKQPIILVGGNAFKNDSVAKDLLKADIYVKKIEDLSFIINQLETQLKNQQDSWV